MLIDRPDPVLGVDEASRDWGADCGPVAIAAALGLPLDHVRPAVSPDGHFKGYMGVRDVRVALGLLGARIVRQWSKPVGPVDVLGIHEALAQATVGTSGEPLVIMLRFCGPWDRAPRAAARFRHLIAYRHVHVAPLESWDQRCAPGWVCDANNQCSVDAAPWAPVKPWRNCTLVHLLPERGDLRVAVDWMAQVDAC